MGSPPACKLPSAGSYQVLNKTIDSNKERAASLQNVLVEVRTRLTRDGSSFSWVKEKVQETKQSGEEIEEKGIEKW